MRDRRPVRSNAAFLLQSRNDIVESFLLDFGREIRTETLDVGNALDNDVPGLPAIRCLAQTEVNRHFVAAGFLDFSTHRRRGIARITLVRKDDESIAGK